MIEGFTVKAVGSDVYLQLDVYVVSGSDIAAKRKSVKNVIFDMLRSQDFQVESIKIVKRENPCGTIPFEDIVKEIEKCQKGEKE